MACKKKLYQRPQRQAALQIDTQRSRTRHWAEPSDPRSLQRAVRHLLARKVSGNLLGLLLLAPEHLRLGTWDLVCGWAGQPGEQVEPRLALQLIHEAALCVTGTREARALAHKGKQECRSYGNWLHAPIGKLPRASPREFVFGV